MWHAVCHVIKLFRIPFEFDLNSQTLEVFSWNAMEEYFHLVELKAKLQTNWSIKEEYVQNWNAQIFLVVLAYDQYCNVQMIKFRMNGINYAQWFIYSQIVVNLFALAFFKKNKYMRVQLHKCIRVCASFISYILVHMPSDCLQVPALLRLFGIFTSQVGIKLGPEDNLVMHQGCNRCNGSSMQWCFLKTIHKL